eukprot:5319370-Prymnesium_polylepis.1
MLRARHRAALAEPHGRVHRRRRAVELHPEVGVRQPAVAVEEQLRTLEPVGGRRAGGEEGRGEARAVRERPVEGERGRAPEAQVGGGVGG